MPSRLQQLLQWCFKRFQLLTVNCPRWSDNVTSQRSARAAQADAPSVAIPSPISNPCPRTSGAQSQPRTNTSTSPLDKRRRQPIDVARAVAVRLPSCCCRRKGTSREGKWAGLWSFPIPFVALSYDYIKQMLRQRITHRVDKSVCPSRSCYCAIKCSSGSCSHTA